MLKYFLGVDLGGTNTVAGIIDTDGKILAKESISTNTSSPESICEGIVKAARILPEKAGISWTNISAAGVGTPGIVCGGTVIYASNLNMSDTPLAAMLEKELNLPVKLHNDANAAAFGEYVVGAGKGKSSLIALTIGTGIGGGIVHNNEIIAGFNGGAGELGHIVVHAGGRECSCGKRGCLEAYCSATSIKKITSEVMLQHKDSIMWELCDGDITKVSAKTAFDAMRNGDIIGEQIVDEFIFYLSLGVSNAINLLQPEVFCIGGGVAHEGDTIILPLREHVKKQTYLKKDEQRPYICTAKLGGDAGLIGAALCGRI